MKSIWDQPGRPSQAILLVAGGLLMGHAVLQDSRPADFASWELAIGAGLLAAATVLPRLRKGKAGPLEFELDPHHSEIDKARETAAEIQSTGRPKVDDDELTAVARQQAGNEAIQALFKLLTERLGDPSIDSRLFLFDQEVQRLLPVKVADGQSTQHRGWAIWEGATGHAYGSKSLVKAVAPHTHDSTYGLKPEEQQRYQDLAVIISTPVINAAGVVIAVISASSRSANSRLATTEAEDVMSYISMLCARILVDLLRWFADE